MATVDWPQGAAFMPSALRWGARTPKSSWQAFYTGQRQSVSHLADRMRCTITLPVVLDRAQAGRREAFFTELASSGDWVRLWHFHRPVPLGTVRFTPRLTAAALSGSRTLSIQTSPGATLLGGDMLGLAGNLLMVGAAGATANASGIMQLPLALPLQVAAAFDSPLTWLRPTGQFELVTQEPVFEYGGGGVQAGMTVELLQVLP